LLVETNPTGHVEADGFFSRFLLVQQSAQKKLSKRKNVSISDTSPAAAARASETTGRPSASIVLQPSPSAALASDSRLAAASQEVHEEAEGSPSSASKLANMQHRKEPSWSAQTQPGANQVAGKSFFDGLRCMW
jgi:hypothetical protein